MGLHPRGTVLIHEYVTGGGLAGSELPASWAAEGAAMRRALAADFGGLPEVRVLMTLDERFPIEAGPWTTVRVGPGREPEVFARLAAEADYTLVIAPETGGCLLDRARVIEEVGGRSLGSAPAAIELAGDKLRLDRYLAARGVPTPPGRWIAPGDGLPPDGPYPAVLKPIDGAGSVDTFLVASAEALPPEARALPEALLQPYLPGVPMSASFLVDPAGPMSLIGLARQRVERRGDRLVYLGGTVPAAAPGAEARRAVAAIPGLCGWVGVDFVWDEATGVTVLDLNPRPTTSYVGLRHCVRSDGSLAWEWLVRFQAPGFCDENDRGDGRDGEETVTFDADGTIHAAGVVP